MITCDNSGSDTPIDDPTAGTKVARMFTLRSAGLSLLCAVSLSAGDWPRFRGPAADGISTEKGWFGSWPGGQPKRIWKSNVGVGFSSMAISDGRLFTMGHNGRKEGGEDNIVALDVATGRELWRHTYPQALEDHYYEGGTSGTPTVDGARVYTVAKSGHALCLDAATGKVIWTQELAGGLGMKLPEWGFAGAPLISETVAIYNAGDAGVALDKATGKQVWAGGKGSAGYGSPVPFSIEGQQAVAIFGLRHVIAVDPSTGRELWRHQWKTQYDVNAADPVIAGDMMFITSGYGTGGSAVKFTKSSTREVWKNKAIRGHMQAPILIGGYVYGVDGNGGDDDSKLKCVELATGKVAWESPKAETGVLAAADGKLIWVTGRGELVVVKADPSKYDEISRAQVTGGKIWATPVLSNGKLYVRNWKGDVLCLDVKGGGGVS